ncbi:MAG: regulatory iron-sulfur-containing complex subunit RicT [Bacteroidota bacterium]
MEENNNEKNIFLSRGCCKAPNVNTGSEDFYQHGCCKLDAHDWLKDIDKPDNKLAFDHIEVRFKNSRKEFFKITDDIDYQIGDIVAVEGLPGHDIGIVSLTGDIVKMQMKKKNFDIKSAEIKKVFRKARPSDVEKWVSAIGIEDITKDKARKIAWDQKLNMKLNDVEYQGDNTKATFYYTAEDRVDFRILIRLLAEEFKVRIEMRQIGVRQEASRLGGIGICGRELCCSTWLTNFRTVSTNAARVQQLSLNPQKLAGQCSKLKCCLNFEQDSYADALKDFPRNDIDLHFKSTTAYYIKTDVHKGTMWFVPKEDSGHFVEFTKEDVKKIIEMNNKGQKPDRMEEFSLKKEKKQAFDKTIEQEDVTRFDKKRK